MTEPMEADGLAGGGEIELQLKFRLVTRNHCVAEITSGAGAAAAPRTKSPRAGQTTLLDSFAGAHAQRTRIFLGRFAHSPHPRQR